VAIGVTAYLPPLLARALRPDPSAFDPIPSPEPGDWLAEHSERGETFQAYVDAKPLRPDETRRVICILPLGSFSRDQHEDLERLRAFVAAFFSLETRALEELSLERARADGFTITERRHFGSRQILTGDILALLRKKLARDAFAVVAVTHEDLYPADDWNFVFGQASLRHRVGVYSLARFGPEEAAGKARSGREDDGKSSDRALEDDAARRKTLRRAAQVLVHETGHIFGLLHCVWFRCVLNGSNSLPESDTQPLSLCPVCLRKLQWNIGFDVADRYEKVSRALDELGLAAEAEWTRKRAAAIAKD
jgi:archaemetzincin